MGQTAIPFPAAARQPEGPRAWFAKADQARRIAMMLAPADAAILEAFARECEARAMARPAASRPAIAA